MAPGFEIELGELDLRLREPAGLQPDYLETPAGHWFPPEVMPRLGAAVAPLLGAASASS